MLVELYSGAKYANIVEIDPVEDNPKMRAHVHLYDREHGDNPVATVPFFEIYAISGYEGQ